MTVKTNGGASGRLLLPHHRKMLETDSGISTEVIHERGYWSATKKAELEELGFGRKAQRVPSLVVPVYGVTGELEWCAHRPDHPRVVEGRQRKYEIPFRASHVIDVPKRVRPRLRDPRSPLVITEGCKKADAAVSRGIDTISVFGTYAFRGTDADTQGKVMLGDWEHIALKDRDDVGRELFLCFDSDVIRKFEVQDAMDRLSALLHRRGARMGYLVLPEGSNGKKVGLDDYLSDHDTDELWSLATRQRPRWLRPSTRDQKAAAPATPMALATVEETFAKYLHLSSRQPLYVLLGAIAANRLSGEPVWLLLVGASGGGKSELVRACNGLPEIATVTKLTEASLLSGTSAREAAADATGGVLRQIGAMGVLSFKDFTSVLSADRDALRMMLGALREIYDGHWTREVGTDGGRQLVWQGKAGLIGGVTSAIDRHHLVIAEMGERLLLYRLPDVEDDDENKVLDRAMKHPGQLDTMRASLAAAVAGLFEHIKDRAPVAATDEERTVLKQIVRFVARARAGVYMNHKGDVIDVAEPEIPARLIQQVERLLAGLDVIGVPRAEAWAATLTTAVSCIPESRRAALAYLHGQEIVDTTQVAKALERPTEGTRSALDGLAAHGLVDKLDRKGRAYHWQLGDLAREAINALPDGVFRGASTSGTHPPLGISPVNDTGGKSPGGYGGATSDDNADDTEDSPTDVLFSQNAIYGADQ